MNHSSTPHRAIISLHSMKFFAYHGYHDFEREAGNNFLIDIDATVELYENPNEELDKTVDYESIYKIAAIHMEKEYKLLETIAFNIAKDIKDTNPLILSVQVKIMKMNPPVGGPVEKSSVSIIL